MKLLLAICIMLALVLGCSGIDSEPMRQEFTLTWTAPGDNDITGTATTYVIRYNTEFITEANWEQSLVACIVDCPVPDTAGTTQSFTFTIDAESDTDYYFAIKAADEMPNWSGLSNIMNLKTDDITPPRWIADLSGRKGP